MYIFDNSFMHVKNEYIVPLSKYSITYPQLGKKNIKETLASTKALTSTIKNIRIIGNKNYSISFDEDIILPALLGDINLCMIRATLQWDATKKICSLQPSCCPNWSIVSDYYYAYYIACTLLRLNFRGTLFFDTATRKTMDYIFSEFVGESVAVGSTCNFTIAKNETYDSECTMNLICNSKGTHEIVWDEVAKLISELLKHATKNTDEYTCLTCINHINQKFGNAFPSQLRNRVNYQLKYGLIAVDKKIFSGKAGETSLEWIMPIIGYTDNQEASDQNIIKLFSSYCQYLHILTFKLIEEYYDLRGRKDGVWSAINKNRFDKIDFPSYPYEY